VGDVKALQRTLLGMSEDVAAYLRKEGECARIVVLKLRYPDFTTITRRTTLPQPTDLAEVIHAQAVRMLQREWKQNMQIRLLGVGATGLVQARQLSFFEEDGQRLSKLSHTVDEIRDKYGKGAIRRASLLKPREREDDEGALSRKAPCDS
jgi:DNA polymerase-4